MRCATTVGMVSAAAVILSGCEGASQPETQEDEALRRAAYRSMAARDRMMQCVGDSQEKGAELRRFETLKDFARRRGARAAQIVWRGENDWNAASGRGAQEPCGSAGEALARFRESLDGLAANIMDHEE